MPGSVIVITPNKQGHDLEINSDNCGSQSIDSLIKCVNSSYKEFDTVKLKIFFKPEWASATNSPRFTSFEKKVEDLLDTLAAKGVKELHLTGGDGGWDSYLPELAVFIGSQNTLQTLVFRNFCVPSGLKHCWSSFYNAIVSTNIRLETQNCEFDPKIQCDVERLRWRAIKEPGVSLTEYAAQMLFVPIKASMKRIQSLSELLSPRNSPS